MTQEFIFFLLFIWIVAGIAAAIIQKKDMESLTPQKFLIILLFGIFGFLFVTFMQKRNEEHNDN